VSGVLSVQGLDQAGDCESFQVRGS